MGGSGTGEKIQLSQAMYVQVTVEHTMRVHKLCHVDSTLHAFDLHPCTCSNANCTRLQLNNELESEISKGGGTTGSVCCTQYPWHQATIKGMSDPTGSALPLPVYPLNSIVSKSEEISSQIHEASQGMIANNIVS